MKRKKWAEQEEQTLINKYSDLLSTGSLTMLKSREKKFRPIADQVNAVHHLLDPVSFPFKWSWRDVSIKVQNMRHQYMGVKQKIRVSDGDFNWEDGGGHWENFLKYKEVFGDVELEEKRKRVGPCCGDDLFDGFEDLEFEDEIEAGDRENFGGEGDGIVCREGGHAEFGKEMENGNMGIWQIAKRKKDFAKKWRLDLLREELLDLKGLIIRREEKRRQKEFDMEMYLLENDEKSRQVEFQRETRWNNNVIRIENRVKELEERELMWKKREFEREERLAKELMEERRRRKVIEERREEEEMNWRQRMVEMQIEHEKAMMQMHADVCHNNMQILGVMARLICQFSGLGDGLVGGLGVPPSHVLQNLQNPGEVTDNVKPDADSPSEFM